MDNSETQTTLCTIHKTKTKQKQPKNNNKKLSNTDTTNK